MVLKKKKEERRGAYHEIKNKPEEYERKSVQRIERVNHSSDLRLQILKALMAVYGIITLPVYFLIQRPWTVWRDQRIIWAKNRREEDPYSPVERIVRNYDTIFEGVFTLDELFRMSVFEYGNIKSFGAREVLDEIEEKDKSGKIFKKLKLGDYRWLSYKEVAERVNSLSKGFLALGLKPRQPIAIFAETRREWFLTLQACVQNNIPVATLYANLGEEGIIHVINETEVSTIVTSQDLLLKLKKISDKVPTLTKVIYMKNLKSADTNGFPSRISIFRLSEIERMGRNCSNVADVQSPCADDLAVIMYTSGSTGMPKGVMISHENIIAMLTGSTDMAPELKGPGTGMSFLPLAHVYGLIMEYGYIRMGAKYGYASPYTLLDNSLGLVEGCKGDMSILKPALFTTVPLLLNRLAKGINEVLTEKGSFAKEFFTYAVEYKEFWWKKGFNSPILNRLVFHKVQQILGGEVKCIISAGAALSPDTQILIRTCFNAVLRPSYGLTELAAAGTSAAAKDYSTGRIGAPYFPCTIKFVDWEEGGYRATDKPNPRGELVIGGPCVTLGYYKNEELTNEVYKEEDGIRWFYTGDIGEMFPDGTFKIIDRKKDLHKLQRGEYVSLGKIEAEMKTSLLVDNICVVGSGSHDHLIALVQPNEQQLRKLATTVGSECLTVSELCQDNEIIDYVTNQLKLHGKTKGLLSFEIPQRFKLCYEEWLPESGLVTAALKLKRKAIEEFYKDSIAEMYAAN